MVCTLHLQSVDAWFEFQGGLGQKGNQSIVLGRGIFFYHALPLKDKNKLSSTTCGEELNIILKDQQGKNGICQKNAQKIGLLSKFLLLNFLTFKTTLEFKFDLICPT